MKYTFCICHMIATCGEKEEKKGKLIAYNTNNDKYTITFFLLCLFLLKVLLLFIQTVNKSQKLTYTLYSRKK